METEKKKLEGLRMLFLPMCTKRSGAVVGREGGSVAGMGHRPRERFCFKPAHLLQYFMSLVDTYVLVGFTL